jgi:hypothetical protein
MIIRPSPVRARLLGVLCLCCLLLAGVSACQNHKRHASMSENQCIASDWATIGYFDGVRGYRTSRLLAHQDACVEYGVVPDRDTYLTGWRQGIGEYCQADNGYAEGVRGAAYDNVCPQDVEADFLAAYEHGRVLYKARSACDAAEAQVAHLEQRRVDIEAQLVSSGTAQLNPLLTPAARIELAASTKRLLDERIAIDRNLPGQRAEAERRRAEVDALEAVPAAIER